ncbi:MAG: hypothetical protein AAFW87_12275 [Pseudomonadota bacterium]
MRRTKLLSLLSASCLALPAWAETPEAIMLSYEQFELAIPHIDLEDCPSSIEATDVFCRATMANNEIHVFAFSNAGDSPLQELNSFPVEEIAEMLK